MTLIVVLSGPIGAGKTTLGRALAAELGGAFIDSDDLRDPSKRWYQEVLTLSEALVRAGMAALRDRPVLVIAKPLRARDWALLRARFAAQGVAARCVTLAADLDAILDPSRRRVFSPDEQRRIAEMIREGYGARPFSDLVVDTGRSGFQTALATLVAASRQWLNGDR